MALVPRLASAPQITSALPFSGASTVSGTMAVPPVEGIEPSYSTTEGEGFYYENFETERHYQEERYVEARRRNRRVVSSLFIGTAQSFADAFAMVERGTTTTEAKKSIAYFRVGSAVYIANLGIVNDDLPKRGEQVSFML